MQIGDIFGCADGIFPQEALDLCRDGKAYIEEVDSVQGFIDKEVIDEPPVIDEETGKVLKEETYKTIKVEATIRRFQIVAIPEPTQEELQARIQKQLTDAVQRVLDNKAQELNYDSCLSVCSYIDTGVSRFDAEGKAFRAWRSAVWAKGYEILAQVQAGEREIPTEAELIGELPELVIEY